MATLSAAVVSVPAPRCSARVEAGSSRLACSRVNACGSSRGGRVQPRSTHGCRTGAITTHTAGSAELLLTSPLGRGAAPRPGGGDQSQRRLCGPEGKGSPRPIEVRHAGEPLEIISRSNALSGYSRVHSNPIHSRRRNASGGGAQLCGAGRRPSSVDQRERCLGRNGQQLEGLEPPVLKQGPFEERSRRAVLASPGPALHL